MSKIALEGNSLGSGTFTIASPNSNSNYTLTLPSSTGTVVVTGGAQTIEFAAGSAASPSITFTGDTNTGIFSPAADTIAFAEGGVESARLNSSGFLGLGYSDPRGRLYVGTADLASGSTDASNGINLKQTSTTAATGIYIERSGERKGYYIYMGGASDSLIFQRNNAGTKSDVMALDRDGNVGIGTSSPATKFHVVGSNNVTRFESSASNVSDYLTFYSGGANRTYFGIETDTGTGIIGSGTAYSTILSTVGSQPLVFGTNSAERARITSDGDFLVGATAKLGNGGGIYVATGGANIQTLTTNSTTNNAYYVLRIYANAVEKGYIYYDGTNVSYTNLSDYRLKENIAPMTGALAKVAQLNPCTFTWKNGGHSGQGFIAHELQEVCPDAVTGEKDATEIQRVEISPAVEATYDEDGNELTPTVDAVYEEREVPKYQGVDTSFLVATLTAAIQELKAITDAQATRIEALEAEVAALKGQ